MASQVNPIIQAMIASAQRQSQVEQQQLEGQRLQQEQQLRERELAQQEQRIEHEHEYQTGLLGVQGQLREAEAERNRIEALNSLRQLSTQNVPMSIIQQLQGALPSLKGVDLSGLPTAASEAQRIQNQARAQAQGTAEGQLPSQITLQNNAAYSQQQLHQIDNQNAKDLATMKINSEERLAKLSDATKRFVSINEVGAQRYRTDLEFGGTPETNQGLQIGMLAGEITPSPTNPLHRAIEAGIINNGGKILKPGETQVLSQLGKIQPLFDRLKNFADKYLPDENDNNPVPAALRAAAQAHGLGIAGALRIPTDVQTDLANIHTQAMNVGRAIEGQTSRPLAAQMELTLQGLTSGGITKQQAYRQLQNLQGLTDNEQGLIEGNMPNEQQDILYNRYGVKPLWLKSAPQVHPQDPSYMLDEDRSIKEGKPAYTKKTASGKVAQQKPSPLGTPVAQPTAQ